MPTPQDPTTAHEDRLKQLDELSEKLRDTKEHILPHAFVIPDLHNNEITLAGILYETYCEQVGGKAFNGDLLPSWTEFLNDPAKGKQAAAWITVARTSMTAKCFMTNLPAFALEKEAEFNPVADTKQRRVEIRDTCEALNKSLRKSRSRSIAITKLEEAGMWLGKDLQEQNEPTPYSASHDPSVKAIDPTAPEACKLAS